MATGSGSTLHPSFLMEGEPYPSCPVAPVTALVKVYEARPEYSPPTFI